jgi:hypothetical protein
MDFDSSGCRSTPASIELTSTQVELLALFDKFVSLVTSDAMVNIQVLPEVCKMLFIGVCGGTLP